MIVLVMDCFCVLFLGGRRVVYVLAEFPDFMTNHLMFSFGTKYVVQDPLISSLVEYIPTDPTCYLFARFCKLLDPLPIAAVNAVLRAISIAFRSGPKPLRACQRCLCVCVSPVVVIVVVCAAADSPPRCCRLPTSRMRSCSSSGGGWTR